MISTMKLILHLQITHESSWLWMGSYLVVILMLLDWCVRTIGKVLLVDFAVVGLCGFMAVLAGCLLH